MNTATIQIAAIAGRDEKDQIGNLFPELLLARKWEGLWCQERRKSCWNNGIFCYCPPLPFFLSSLLTDVQNVISDTSKLPWRVLAFPSLWHSKKREEREKSAFLSVREDVLCVIMRGYWIYRMVHRQRKEKPLLTFDTFFTGLQLKRREEKNPLLFFLFLLLVKWIDPEPFMFIWCSPRGMWE